MLRKSPSERPMSQILSLPFMTMQTSNKETRLQHSSGKGFVPRTLHSGLATMSSSNHTVSHHHHSRSHSGCPLRATDMSTPCTNKQRKAGSLQDAVLPLNAVRLDPSQHETRREVLCITEESKVCFKSKSGSHSSSSEAGRTSDMDQQITDIMQVSSDGMNIEIYRPLSTSQSNEDSPHQTPSPQYPGFYLYTSFKYHNLPNYRGPLKQYWKKYQHLCVYVNMVRAKTAKVTLYTPQAKCVLMENDPDADFEVLFNNGAKIYQTSSSTRFIEEGGRTYLVEKGEEVPEAMQALHEHAQEGLRKCKSIEQAAVELEFHGSGGNYFPIITGQRRRLPTPTTNPQDASSRGNCGSSKGHLSDSLTTQMSSYQSTSADSLVSGAVSSRRNLSGGGEERSKNLQSWQLVQSRTEHLEMAHSWSYSPLASAAFEYTDPQGQELSFGKTDKFQSTSNPSSCIPQRS